ncbi:MAG: TatD family hydrolase [Chitinophagaceae bacterium]
MMIDTHCHLYADAFDKDRKAMMERAIAAGVNKFYLPAIDSTVIDGMLQMEKDYAGHCFAMMGLHPCSVKEDYEKELGIAESWLKQRKFAAIGETGLDFYWDKTYTAQQYEAFKKQIVWAKEYKIPIVIHSRESTPECIAVIKEMYDANLTGVFHCFGGSIEEAEQIIDLGFYLGIGGVITYKNSGLAAVIAQLPLDNIVLETDAPYLSPVPFRGKRNESSYLVHVVQKIAEAKNISTTEVEEITTQNAQLLFEKV